MRRYFSNHPGWEIQAAMREAPEGRGQRPPCPPPPPPTPPKLLRGSRLRLPARLLVRLDRAAEIAELLARDEAERVERLQMFLGVGQIVEHEVRLPDVLVGALVLGVDGERLLVDRNGGAGVAVLTGGIREPVVGIRVLPVARG